MVDGGPHIETNYALLDTLSISRCSVSNLLDVRLKLLLGDDRFQFLESIFIAEIPPFRLRWLDWIF